MNTSLLNTIPADAIYITMGDPSGVGPELVAMMFHNSKLIGKERAIVIGRKRAIVIGEYWLLKKTCENLNYPDYFCEFSETNKNPNRIPVISLNLITPDNLILKTISPTSGNAAFAYLDLAISLCMDKKGMGIVTAPLHKEAMNLAGHKYMGHTEILSHKTNRDVVMTIIHPKIWVSHVSDHLSLLDAINAVTKKRVLQVLEYTWKGLKATGISSPRIAVSGLNPHAGEGGILGREEIEIIKPAIDTFNESMKKKYAEGFVNVSGPLPGDTIFYIALKGSYDGVVAMYHDQGFGPMKTLDMAHSVNCTLGLPFVRTSPDHGTAFDITGTGKVDPSSMIEAWNVACRLISNESFLSP